MRVWGLVLLVAFTDDGVLRRGRDELAQTPGKEFEPTVKLTVGFSFVCEGKSWPIYKPIRGSSWPTPDTPVSAYVKLCAGEDNSFLFESGEGVDSVGRYSIVAWDPISSLRLESEAVFLEHQGQASQHAPEEFFDVAQRVMDELACEGLPPLPFVGSLMGYVGYEAVRLVERLPALPPHPLPVARLCFPARFAVFDHLRRKLTPGGSGP